MSYAFVDDGIVGYIETRTPLSDLVHPDFLPYFIEIPEELEGIVQPGWLYEDGGFKEPPTPEPEPEPEPSETPTYEELLSMYSAIERGLTT